MLSKFPRAGSCLFAATLSLTTLIAGCGSGDEHAGSENIEATSNEVTVPVTAVTSTLVEPGSEPRSKVLLRPRPGTTQQAVLTTDAQVFQQIDDQAPRDFSTPQLAIPLEASVSEVISTTTPHMTVDLTLGPVATPDATLADVLEPVAGSHAGLTISPSGAITALRLEPAPDAKNAARAAVEQALYQAVYRAVSFPEDDIGVGAAWTIRQQVMSGIALDQITTATLTARDGNLLTVDLQMTQTPQSSVWELPNNAGSLHVDSYVLQGSGTITVDLGLPLPVAGTLTVGGDQAYSDPAGTSRLRQSMTYRVQWSE